MSLTGIEGGTPRTRAIKNELDAWKWIENNNIDTATIESIMNSIVIKAMIKRTKKDVVFEKMKSSLTDLELAIYILLEAKELNKILGSQTN